MRSKYISRAYLGLTGSIPGVLSQAAQSTLSRMSFCEENTVPWIHRGWKWNITNHKHNNAYAYTQSHKHTHTSPPLSFFLFLPESQASSATRQPCRKSTHREMISIVLSWCFYRQISPRACEGRAQTRKGPRATEGITQGEKFVSSKQCYVGGLVTVERGKNIWEGQRSRDVERKLYIPPAPLDRRERRILSRMAQRRMSHRGHRLTKAVE